ncbi:MAG: phenylalanine--tRNA ligase subunit beta, partial [Oscillospiraceae bacterium]
EGETNKIYKPLPKFPAVERDLAFVCENTIPVLKLEKIIAEAIGKMLEKVELFDVYEGTQIADGMKSVAFSLKLRATDKTMTDEDADLAVKKAIKALENIGISLRS